MPEPSTTHYRPSPLEIQLVFGLTNVIFGSTVAVIRPALIPAIFAIILTWVYFAAVVCAPKPHPGANAWVIGTVAREQITPLFVFNSSSSIIAILYLNIAVILWLTTFIIFIVLSAEGWDECIFPTIISGIVWILMSYILLRTAIAWRKEKKTIALETDQQNLSGHAERGAPGVM